MTLRSELHGRELVAVKESGSAEALRHEAALLEDLDHPGVIGLVALIDDERGLRLLTRYAGRDTLATWQPPRLEEFRRVVEEVAETVCYLHERGIVHRDIRPGHVVIDALRRPLLCSFSAARRDAGDDPAAQLADVKAIGETVQATLQRLEAQPRRPDRRRHAQLLRRRLLAVAQAAADGRVPSSRALASRLRAAGGESRSPHRGAGRPQTESPGRAAAIRPRPPAPVGRRTAGPLRRHSRRATWLAAAVCAGCILGTVMVLRLGEGTTAAPAVVTSASLGTPSRSAAPALPEAAAQQTPPSESPTTQPDPRQRPERALDSPDPAGSATARCPGPGSGLRDIDGDGCAEQIRITSGFVSVDGVRYPVGSPEDQVAVGDWDCDGIATVAVVQPTGRVYLFGDWPQQGPLVGTLVAELPPPVELADVARGACNELTVRYREGTWYLPLPAASG
ncbi:MAG: protein kinase family protein [Acidimicrobiia bacterium]|nr:protein kinase family protein [Acidimicrobiia bacterium]MYC46120.1 protein kinase family protein [Acidimicrobiia bacterium]